MFLSCISCAVTYRRELVTLTGYLTRLTQGVMG